MPKPYSTILYDATGKPVGQAPDDPEELKKIFATGQYGFLKGQRVNWRAPDGSLASYETSGAKVKQLIDAGYQLETSGARDARQQEEEYGGTEGQVKSFLHGVGNTLTFGGLDVIGEAAAGKGYTSEVKKIKEASPIANVAGNITGIIAPFLLPGGQAGALAGIGKLGAGVKGVAKVGRAAEKFVLKELGGPGQGIVRQALAKGTSLGVGAGIEGAAYGAGQFMSEQALGDIDATAENLIAHTGMGMMWGGVGGGALGSGGTIIRRGLGAGANYAKRAKGSIVKMYEKATGVKPAEGLVDEVGKALDQPATPGLLSRIKAKFTGAKAESFETFKDPENLRLAQQADEIVNETTETISSKLDDMRVLKEEVYEQGKGIEKYRNMDEIVKKSEPVMTVVENRGLLSEFDRELDGMIAAGSDRFAAPKLIEDFKAMAQKADDVIAGAARETNPRVAGITFIEQDRLKRYMQNRIAKLARKAGKTVQEQDTLAALESIETRLRKHLEIEDIWGAAGVAQKNVNAEWVRNLAKIKMGRRFEEVYAQAAEGYDNIYKTNRGTVKGTLNSWGMPENKFPQEFMVEWAGKDVRLAKAMDEAFDLPPKLKAKISQMEKLETEIGGLLKHTEKTVGVRNQLADIVTKSNQFSSVLPSGIAGAGVGYALGGPEGAALGIGLSMFTNPGKFLNIKAALHRMSSQTEVKTAKALKDYIRKATGKAVAVKKPVRALVAPVSMKILQDSNWGAKRTKDETRHKAFERRAKELTEFLSNQEKTVETITRNTAPVAEVAPETAQAMQVKAVQTARYAYDRMPKPLGQDTLLTGEWKPSDLDLAKWERIVAVLDNPENALKSLRAGMLTVEEVDALRANYPRMYERIVVTLAEQIPELRKELPYKERVQLSILFDVPVDATMEPEFMQTMAVVGMVSPMPPGETPGQKQPRSKAATGDYDKLSIDTASMTDTQGTEYRKLT